MAYADPQTGAIVRITPAEWRARVEIVRNALADVDGGAKILLTGSGHPILISFDQINLMARRMVREGAIDPGEESTWIAERVNASREAARPVRDLLQALENPVRGGNAGVAGGFSGFASFRGGLRGTWELPCRRNQRDSRMWGTWYLTFAGDGTMSGWFEDQQGARRAASGTIDDGGYTGGQARDLELRASFDRDGNSLAFRAGAQGQLYLTEAAKRAEPERTCGGGSWRKD